MRESLGKLKATVEQERRLNTSIKEKKVGCGEMLFHHFTTCHKVPHQY